MLIFWFSVEGIGKQNLNCQSGCQIFRQAAHSNWSKMYFRRKYSFFSVAELAPNNLSPLPKQLLRCCCAKVSFVSWIIFPGQSIYRVGSERTRNLRWVDRVANRKNSSDTRVWYGRIGFCHSTFCRDLEEWFVIRTEEGVASLREILEENLDQLWLPSWRASWWKREANNACVWILVCCVRRIIHCCWPESSISSRKKGARRKE